MNVQPGKSTKRIPPHELRTLGRKHRLGYFRDQACGNALGVLLRSLRLERGLRVDQVSLNGFPCVDHIDIMETTGRLPQNATVFSAVVPLLAKMHETKELTAQQWACVAQAARCRVDDLRDEAMALLASFRAGVEA